MSMMKAGKQTKTEVKFLPPGEGESRCIFTLDPLQQTAEEDHMVELLPGRVEEVDGVNQYFITGGVETHKLEGVGHPYYRVILGPTERTRKSCPQDVQPTRKFVPLGRRDLIPYNSKLPFVVYMPSGAELRYRVWAGGKECVAEEQPTAREKYLAEEEQPAAREKYLAEEEQSAAREKYLAEEEQPAAREKYLAEEEQSAAREKYLAEEEQPAAREKYLAEEEQSAAREKYLAEEEQPAAREKYLAEEEL